MASTVTLPPDLAAKVQAHVDSGAAASAVDVVRAGLEALEAAEAAKLETIRSKLASSLADPADSIPSEDVFARVEALLART
mgnify:CR=1 FL=1